MALKRGRDGGSAAFDLADRIPSAKSVGSKQKSETESFQITRRRARTTRFGGQAIDALEESLT